METKKILVVDDDIYFLGELMDALRTSGYAITGASDPFSVVRIADALKPDLILLDMKLNGKSGFQVADDLKHIPGTKFIPIMAMTGYFTEQQHQVFMKDLGIRECIVKPFNPEELISRIRSVVT